MLLLNHFPNGVRIQAIGHFLPDEVVSNQQLIAESGLPISDEWIQKRIGVRQRHRVAPEMATSDMAIAAARKTLQNINPHTLDAIILSTISPDHPNPATACAIQAGLGISETRCPCFDISAACSGFIYALDMGTRYILTGAKRVLVVSAEIRSRFLNPSDPSTYPIFGDGAAAVILEPSPNGEGILGIQTMADGRGYDSVYIPAGGSRKPASIDTVSRQEHTIRMTQGEKIFFEVVEGMSHYTLRFLEQCGISLSEIDFVIPHQANLNILQEVGRRLSLPPEKMLINIQEVGNTSSASIPIAWAQFQEKGTITPGSLLLLVAAGAGHTMGLALVKV